MAEHPPVPSVLLPHKTDHYHINIQAHSPKILTGDKSRCCGQASKEGGGFPTCRPAFLRSFCTRLTTSRARPASRRLSSGRMSRTAMTSPSAQASMSSGAMPSGRLKSRCTCTAAAQSFRPSQRRLSHLNSYCTYDTSVRVQTQQRSREPQATRTLQPPEVVLSARPNQEPQLAAVNARYASCAGRQDSLPRGKLQLNDKAYRMLPESALQHMAFSVGVPHLCMLRSTLPVAWKRHVNVNHGCVTQGGEQLWNVP